MDILLQVIVTGLAAGGVYGLIALGFVLIYKATSVLNLAMGEFMTLGAFICFTALMQLSAPFYLAFILTLFLAFALGFVIERLILRPLIGEPIISVIMVTIPTSEGDIPRPPSTTLTLSPTLRLIFFLLSKYWQASIE